MIQTDRIWRFGPAAWQPSWCDTASMTARLLWWRRLGLLSCHWRKAKNARGPGIASPAVEPLKAPRYTRATRVWMSERPAMQTKPITGPGALGLRIADCRLRIADCGVRIEGWMPGMTNMGGCVEQTQFGGSGRWCAWHTLRNRGKPAVRNRADFHETGNRKQLAGKQIADRAKQSQIQEKWGIWEEVNVMCRVVPPQRRSRQTKPIRVSRGQW
jgi:hypothetical protein